VAVSPIEERDSYRKVKDVTVFQDTKWRPRFDEWNAVAWIDLLKWFDAKIKGDVEIIGFDTGSRLSENAWHEALKMYRTDDPSSLGKSWGAPWQQFQALIEEWLSMISSAVAAGKIVIVNWHGEMREMEGVGEAKVKPAKPGEKQDILWEDSLVPRIRGSIRDAVPQQFSLWLHAGIDPAGGATKRYLTAGVTTARIGRSRRSLKGGPRFANDLNTILTAGGLLDGSGDSDAGSPAGRSRTAQAAAKG
jgi:hypothetical protein